MEKFSEDIFFDNFSLGKVFNRLNADWNESGINCLLGPGKRPEDVGCRTEKRSQLISDNICLNFYLLFIYASYIHSSGVDIFCYYNDGLECVGHSFVYVAHFVFSKYVWIRTQ